MLLILKNDFVKSNDYIIMALKQKASQSKSLRDFKNASERRTYLEEIAQVNLQNTGNFTFQEEQVNGKNIENLIGAAQIPLGIAGPLRIKNSELRSKDIYIPLATTEGALVASVSRGCKAVTESGGVNVWAENNGMTRGPVFYTGSLEKSKKLRQWFATNSETIKKVTESTSLHLIFKKVDIKMLAEYVFVRFSFDTADAMGMNMVTIATQKAVELIEKETGIQCLALAGNFDIDKKPAWMNFLHNRGYAVWAEAKIQKEVLKNVLKTTAERIFDVWLGKCMLGSAMSGSLGFNAQFANIIAAIYIATGQDPAHIVEGSLGVTTAKIQESGDLSLSVYLPSVIIGTVGGGTGLPTQKEALEILGVKGEGKALQFAEIIGGAVLAGELSLLASLSEGTLAKAHKELGRGGQ